MRECFLAPASLNFNVLELSILEELCISNLGVLFLRKILSNHHSGLIEILVSYNYLYKIPGQRN